ncbi:MAG: M24 family metallopeptidase [Armatimonadetes bacterium]|nr:M24 family metallopeptidase [Armatimonadota bacterium]MDI9601299.1 M24 family metallopeptidase [Acidobacteriota bacterium]NLN91188.1 M24 family metallopeptidase [candidate division WS1 bacterium]
MRYMLVGIAIAALLAGASQAQFGDSALSPPVITAAQRNEEITIKMFRLTTWLQEEGYGGVLINQYRNFQWITGGADMQVVTASERGPVTLVITATGGRYFLCSNSEDLRMQNEELGALGYEGVAWPWYEGASDSETMARAVAGIAQGRPLASDFDTPLATNESEALRGLRLVLTQSEIEKYRWLGRQCAEACEKVCREIEPGMTEKQVQAMISSELMFRDIQPTVLLMASDERLFSYRHPIATDKPVEKYVQVNICAKKWGLVIAVTRYVHFGPLPGDLGRKLRGCAQVCGAYLGATREGNTAGDVIAAGQEAFAFVGWPDEWQMHHQGGAIAYEEREWTGYPGARMPIQANMAFAWNPTIQGAKVEDTVLLREDGVLENLTDTGNWPTIPVRVGDQVYNAPSILVR